MKTLRLSFATYKWLAAGGAAELPRGQCLILVSEAQREATDGRRWQSAQVPGA